MIDKFYQVLLIRLREVMAENIKSCIDNSFTTLEEYKFSNGIIRGIEISENIVIDLFKDWYEMKSLNKEVKRDGATFELYSSS